MQLQAWEGDFGDSYTDRNMLDWRLRVPAFREMLAGLSIQRLLEVGCNRGHNLVALADMLGGEDIVGVEPNEHALALARAATTRAGFLHGNVFDLPFKDGFFDLVFTAGVLIHLPAADLPAALAEIHRVSRRYVLAIEYFAEHETAIPYRGRDDLLWKRDFCRSYQEQFPGLQVVKSGYWTIEQGFDRTHWWLFEKTARTG